MYALARRLAAGAGDPSMAVGESHRPLPARALRLPPERPEPRLPAARLPRRGPRGLLPAVLRDDGADAAHARHPEPRRDRLRPGRPRPRAQQLPRRRHRRPRLGRGLLPLDRLGHLRPDAGRRAGRDAARRQRPGGHQVPRPAEKSTGPAFPDSPTRPRRPAESTRPAGRPRAGGASARARMRGSRSARPRRALALAALAAYGWRRWRRDHLEPGPAGRGGARRARPGARADRLSPCRPGATLRRAEDLLDGSPGRAAAATPPGSGSRRYRHPGAEPPGHRRAPRPAPRAAAKAGGRRSWLRVLLAIPPGGPASPRTGRGESTTNR